jgi:ATPase family associated with various cellular activities (AAA)
MTDAPAHLQLRLRPIRRALTAAVERLTGTIDHAARATHVEPDLVSTGLASLDDLLRAGSLAGVAVEQTADEVAHEAELRTQARLALDVIANVAALDAFEQQALLVCAAAELDDRFAKAIAFLQDDATRRFPTVRWLASWTCTTIAELPARRFALSRLGRLRRYGLLSVLAAEHALDDQLVLGPNVLDALLGACELQPRDPHERGGALPLPSCVDPARLAELAVAMRDGAAAIVGVWGPRRAGHDAVVLALASQLGTRARTVPPGDGDPAQRIAVACSDAEALEQLLWIDCDELQPQPLALDALARSNVRACLTGRRPVRPSSVLALRPYVELSLAEPLQSDRGAAWHSATRLDAATSADLAARYRFGHVEIAAVARMAEATLHLGEGNHARAIEVAAARLAHPHGHAFAQVLRAKRGPCDLVLKPDLHGHILDVANAYRAWPVVREKWGFVQSRGFKALFAGEPGTGKTLAAEVISHELGLPLVKIDVSQVVSKWIGETEKNLDLVFREAEDGNAVLFFDEADALFGKRGAVERGTDRYANLEVSFLLQRLEEHDGLVILATNLQGQMDKAFTRRFHVIAHFPRPAEPERLRLWQLALPTQAPLAADVDLSPFAKLDLTGAAITAAARTAALHAASSGGEQITAADLVYGVASQFRREARSLPASELGRYGHHLRSLS